ncbi:MAG: YegS/Rv2252/BmrU family lipid kinase [Deltaproteobacteria bacterium]|nr:YegS/Rv2252/BmrU family lipid kinase [Deltaproteobacteria bacterium]
MKAIAILNPQSRNGSDSGFAATLERKLAGSIMRIERTSSPQKAAEVSRCAVRSNVETLIVAGGDGTVNAVLNSLAGTRVALGIIPAGTANDLASLHGIPGNVSQACDVVLERRLRPIDLIRVNGWHYATAGGLGLPSQVARIANAIKHRTVFGKRVDHWLDSNLYLLAAAVALITKHAPPSRAEIHWNNHSFTANLLALMISNQPVVGRRFQLSPEAVNDDGQFDVCLIENSGSRVQSAATLLRVLRGRHTGMKSVRIWRGERLFVCSESSIRFLADGEVHEAGRALAIEIVPRGLNLIVPNPRYQKRFQPNASTVENRT